MYAEASVVFMGSWLPFILDSVCSGRCGHPYLRGRYPEGRDQAYLGEDSSLLHGVCKKRSGARLWRRSDRLCTVSEVKPVGGVIRIQVSRTAHPREIVAPPRVFHHGLNGW